jgi:hypothetical protein
MPRHPGFHLIVYGHRGGNKDTPVGRYRAGGLQRKTAFPAAAAA